MPMGIWVIDTLGAAVAADDDSIHNPQTNVTPHAVAVLNLIIYCTTYGYSSHAKPLAVVDTNEVSSSDLSSTGNQFKELDT